MPCMMKVARVRLPFLRRHIDSTEAEKDLAQATEAVKSAEENRTRAKGYLGEARAESRKLKWHVDHDGFTDLFEKVMQKGD